MSKKFKVGDKVLVTNDKHPCDDGVCNIVWISSMNKFKGRVVTIAKILSENNYFFYAIKEDKQVNFWSSIWFQNCNKTSRMESFLQNMEVSNGKN